MLLPPNITYEPGTPTKTFPPQVVGRSAGPDHFGELSVSLKEVSHYAMMSCVYPKYAIL